MMTNEEFRKAQEGIGINNTDLASLFDVSGQLIAAWRNASRPVPSVVAETMLAMASGWRPGDGEAIWAKAIKRADGTPCRFRAVAGYDGKYQISDTGVLLRSASIKKGTITARGYLKYVLSKGGVEVGATAHSLVAAAFIGGRPEGFHVDHIDGDKTNNHVENLRYCTPKENAANNIRLGKQARGFKHGMAKLTVEQVRYIKAKKAVGIKEWGCCAIAHELGVSFSTITRAAKRDCF